MLARQLYVVSTCTGCYIVAMILDIKKATRMKEDSKGHREESSCRCVKREIFCKAGVAPGMHTAVTGR